MLNDRLGKENRYRVAKLPEAFTPRTRELVFIREALQTRSLAHTEIAQSSIIALESVLAARTTVIARLEGLRGRVIRTAGMTWIGSGTRIPRVIENMRVVLLVAWFWKSLQCVPNGLPATFKERGPFCLESLNALVGNVRRTRSPHLMLPPVAAIHPLCVLQRVVAVRRNNRAPGNPQISTNRHDEHTMPSLRDPEVRGVD